jgi:hypothetical protein
MTFVHCELRGIGFVEGRHTGAKRKTAQAMTDGESLLGRPPAITQRAGVVL